MEISLHRGFSFIRELVKTNMTSADSDLTDIEGGTDTRFIRHFIRPPEKRLDILREM